MKNQYFGDRNDFFKYDLVLTLIEKIDNLKHFTFIPMLTEDDGRGDGNLIKYDGSRRKDLEDFLKNCIKRQDRNIKNLRAFMSSYNIEYYPYRDTEHFSHKKRRQYFNDVESSFLNESVILIDPDNGFEVKSIRSGNGHKYLKYDELNKICVRMSSSSLVLVYQHIPRVNREAYFARIGERICEYTGARVPICLTDNRIVFFIIAKTDDLLAEIWEVTSYYAKNNGYKAYRYEDDFGMRPGL